jgi:hypothetical protein
VVLRVGVAGFVGGTVLDDLAVSADMDMRVSQYRRHDAERQRKPGEIELPAYHHEVTDCGSVAQVGACGLYLTGNIRLSLVLVKRRLFGGDVLNLAFRETFTICGRNPRNAVPQQN